MKTLLISALTSTNDQGLRTMSSVLKREGQDVEMIFMPSDKPYTKKELNQLTPFCEGCDLVGISALSWDALKTIQIIEFIKDKVPYIVWGGIHATLCPEKCIKHCDIVCVGEGEGAILELVKAIENKSSIENIKNLWIKKNGKIIRNSVRDNIDNLDELPFPDYSLDKHFVLKDGEIRRFVESDFKKFINFMGSRGCPYGCAYCSNNVFNRIYQGKRKKIVRMHSIDYIIKNLTKLKNKYPSIKHIEVADDVFFTRSKEEIKEFCERFRNEVGLKFCCTTDPKTISEEKVKILSDSDCYMIAIGIQSNERVNKEVYHRNISDEDVLRCAKILNKYKDKVTCSYDILTCNPYENPDDVLKTINLIRKLPRPYRLAVFGLIYFPETDITRRAIKDGFITDEDLFNPLDYFNRGKHLLRNRRHLYLSIILSLMRGISINDKIGFIRDSWFDFLLDEKRIQRNINNQFLSIFFIRILIIHDFIKYKVLKKLYMKLPEGFRMKILKLRLKEG